jgi:hypothetical protein
MDGNQAHGNNTLYYCKNLEVSGKYIKRTKRLIFAPLTRVCVKSIKTGISLRLTQCDIGRQWEPLHLACSNAVFGACLPELGRTLAV